MRAIFAMRAIGRKKRNTKPCQPTLGKKLIMREQHDENLFSIMLPSMKLFGEVKKPIKD